MDPKLLTENGWKSTAQKFKVKDTGLQRALAIYEKLPEDKYAERLKALAAVAQLATAMKRVKEVVPLRDVLKYLTDMFSATQSGQRDITQARTAAEKAEVLAVKTEAANQKKAADEAKKIEQEADGEAGEEADETGDSIARLKNAILALKTSKDPYYFLVCDAKPYGLLISKKDIRKSTQHKKELARLSGGSTRAPRFGTCQHESGTLVFEMDKPQAGLARILQKWIKASTTLGLKVRIGDESADDESEPSAVAAAAKSQSADAARPGQQAEPGPVPAEAMVPEVTGPLSLGASVGRGGKNKPEDVLAVQKALNNRVKAGVSENGKCDAKTLKAIADFQKRLGQFKPDGLIAPGRGPARALASTAKLGPPPEPPKPIAPPKLGKPVLAKAPAVWHGTREILATNIAELKKGVLAHYGSEHPELLKEIDENLNKLGGILGKLDHKLADSLTKANAAAVGAARNAELKNSKTILDDYLNYVKSEPMIAHVDDNPFGVDTNLKKVLMDSLKHIAQAIR